MNALTTAWRRRLLGMTLGAFLLAPLSVADAGPAVAATGTTYYVATSGADTNSGTSLSSPFRTIQKAATAAQPGDTVQIRGGTYRETVTPAQSGTAADRITYTNYSGETVTVSGNDIVSNWTLDSGNVYKASMAWTLGAGNQVFVGTAMMDEARWPNQTGTLLQPTRATVASGSDATHIVHSALPGGNGFWNGATLWTTSGKSWIAMTSTITGHDAATKKLTFDPLKSTGDYYDPIAGNRFYLSGIRGALDTQKEWWYDPTTSQLYLWAPGGVNPSSLVVEAKRRTVAFDLSGKGYVDVTGIHTTAATIVTDSATNNCVLADLTARYISHNKLNTSAGEQGGMGIILDGTDNVLRDSELMGSSSSLVTVNGLRNQVVNNDIHDGAYVPSWEGLVNLNGHDSLISHNTVREAGRAAIFFGTTMKANEIEYNNLYNAGWLTKDLGMLYGPNTDGANTEIHHNWVHDSKAEHLGMSIYLDNYTSNFIVHHNVTWNTESMRLNIPTNYNLVYNNTSWTNAGDLEAWGNTFTTDLFGVRVFNNIVHGLDPEVSTYTTHGNNLMAAPAFVDEAARDYRLTSTSPAKDAGIVIPGITDGYVGSAPDIGAYEYGGTNWTAGHDFATPPQPTYSLTGTPTMNLASNAGFELGNLDRWSKTDAGNAVVVNENHWGKAENVGASRSQFYGVKLSGGIDGVAQTITGLTPNTDYLAAGWVRSPTGETALVGVRDYGGAATSTPSTSSTWTLVKVKFTTGPANTSATIYFKKGSGTGAVYADDAGLTLDSTVYAGYWPTEGFEDGLANWQGVPGKGSPSTSTAVKHSGSNSYVVNEDMDAIGQQFPTSRNKVVKLWFYDDVSTNAMKTAAFVDDGAARRALAVDTVTSTTNYSVRVGSAYSATTVDRTEGWHQFTWDYTSGTKVDMYIDGTLVASPAGMSSFNRIEFGDFWPGNTNTSYFDDVSILDAPLADDFENGLTGWTQTQGTMSLSTVKAHSGSSSYVINEDTDTITRTFTLSRNNVVTVWFYDNGGTTNIKTAAFVDDGVERRALALDAPTSTTHYSVRVGSEYTETTVQRTTGWHEFKWDYRSRVKVSMYIDGTLVASPTGLTTYKQIQLGDLWAGNTNTAYFDDLDVG